MLAVHETAEEFGTPRVRREADDGDKIIEAPLHEEHEAKDLPLQIEKLDITSQQFIDELTKLLAAVLHHAQQEEGDEFPVLERALDTDDLKRMATAMRGAEAIAPIRSHPGVESA